MSTLLKEQNELECSICMETIQRDEVMVKLECQHVYHYNCIHRWLECKRQCPICKRVTSVEVYRRSPKFEVERLRRVTQIIDFYFL